MDPAVHWDKLPTCSIRNILTFLDPCSTLTEDHKTGKLINWRAPSMTNWPLNDRWHCIICGVWFALYNGVKFPVKVYIGRIRSFTFYECQDCYIILRGLSIYTKAYFK